MVIRLKEWKQHSSTQTPLPTAAQVSDLLFRTVGAFSSLRTDKDISLARLAGLDFKDTDVPLAIASCSYALHSSKHLIGLLLWFCLKLLPNLQAKFPVYLKALIEYEQQDLLEEKDIKEWSDCTAEIILETLPAGHKISIEDINKIKSSPTMKAFLNWLEANNDDDDEEEDDEEED